MTEVASVKELDNIIRLNPRVATNFGASWSAVCRAYDEKFENIAVNYDNVFFAKVDIDQIEGGDVLAQYNISAVPTFITFKNSQEFGNRVVGPAESALRRQIADVAK